MFRPTEDPNLLRQRLGSAIGENEIIDLLRQRSGSAVGENEITAENASFMNLPPEVRERLHLERLRKLRAMQARTGSHLTRSERARIDSTQGSDLLPATEGASDTSSALMMLNQRGAPSASLSSDYEESLRDPVLDDNFPDATYGEQTPTDNLEEKLYSEEKTIDDSADFTLDEIKKRYGMYGDISDNLAGVIQNYVTVKNQLTPREQDILQRVTDEENRPSQSTNFMDAVYKGQQFDRGIYG